MTDWANFLDEQEEVISKEVDKIKLSEGGLLRKVIITCPMLLCKVIMTCFNAPPQSYYDLFQCSSAKLL